MLLLRVRGSTVRIGTEYVLGVPPASIRRMRSVWRSCSSSADSAVQCRPQAERTLRAYIPIGSPFALPPRRFALVAGTRVPHRLSLRYWMRSAAYWMQLWCRAFLFRFRFRFARFRSFRSMHMRGLAPCTCVPQPHSGAEPSMPEWNPETGFERPVDPPSRQKGGPGKKKQR